MEFKKLLFALFILFASIATISNATWTAPANACGWRNVSINNLQSNAIAANTQIDLQFNALLDNSCALGKLTNVYTYNGWSASNVLGWLEDNNSNSLGIQNLWINPTWSIAAASTNSVNSITIVYSSGVNAIDGTNMGAAPNLFSSYALWDNGYKVFPVLYANFNGMSTDPRFTKNGALTYNNGVDWNSGDIETIASFGSDQTQIVEALVNVNTINADMDGLAYTSGSFANHNLAGVGTTVNNGGNCIPFYCLIGGGFGSGYNTLNTMITQSANYKVFGLQYDEGTTYNGFVSYKSFTQIIAPSGTATTYPIGLGSDGNLDVGSSFWIRIRTEPPSYVNPSVTLSPFQTTSSTSTTTTSTTSTSTSTSTTTTTTTRTTTTTTIVTQAQLYNDSKYGSLPSTTLQIFDIPFMYALLVFLGSGIGYAVSRKISLTMISGCIIIIAIAGIYISQQSFQIFATFWILGTIAAVGIDIAINWQHNHRR